MKKLFLYSVLTMSVLGSISCSSDDDSKPENFTLTPGSTTTNYDKSIQFAAANNGSPISVTQFTWSISDSKRASISNQGYFTAKKVGEVEVLATKDGKTIKSKITISPYQTFFKEPSMLFGKTKAEVKASETRVLLNETSTGLGYKGENSNIVNLAYIFDSSGKMTSAVVAFPSSTASIDKVSTYYKERYDVLSAQNNVISLKDMDQPIYMMMGVNNTNLQITVVYTKQ